MVLHALVLNEIKIPTNILKDFIRKQDFGVYSEFKDVQVFGSEESNDVN
jgi:hypothetical protein